MSLRAVIAAAAAVAAIATVTAGVASAAPADRASCTAILTSFEATQLPAGSVGGEVSGLAGPDFGVVVSRLASSRLGSLKSCAAIAP